MTAVSSGPRAPVSPGDPGEHEGEKDGLGEVGGGDRREQCGG